MWRVTCDPIHYKLLPDEWREKRPWVKHRLLVTRVKSIWRLARMIDDYERMNLAFRSQPDWCRMSSERLRWQRDTRLNLVRNARKLAAKRYQVRSCGRSSPDSFASWDYEKQGEILCTEKNGVVPDHCRDGDHCQKNYIKCMKFRCMIKYRKYWLGRSPHGHIVGRSLNSSNTKEIFSLNKQRISYCHNRLTHVVGDTLLWEKMFFSFI